MFEYNVSGQFVYFALTSLFSGNLVTGASGSISGRRSIDGGALGLFSGYIIEVTSGQGQYALCAYDFDFKGKDLGFLFTSSGCNPVNYTIVTDLSLSGRTYPASGQVYIASGPNAVVPPSTLSGVVANSGLFIGNPGSVTAASGLYVTVPINTVSGLNAVVPPATLSGVVANSGLYVTVLPANLSGVVANSGLNVVATAGSGLFVTVPISTISGLNAVVPPASLSGVVANSGLQVSLSIFDSPSLYTGTAMSGGSNTISIPNPPFSGVAAILNGNSIKIVGGTGMGQSRVITQTTTSGLLTVDNSWTVQPDGTSVFAVLDYHAAATDANQAVTVGTVLTTASGQVRIASGGFVTVLPATLSGVVANSGLNVVTTVSPASISGVYATVLPANLSGVIANSGLYVTVLPATLSGVVANSGLYVGNPGSISAASGLYVIVPPITISGVNAIVPPATLSGVVANSGLYMGNPGAVSAASGLYVTVPINTISGVVANSGLFVTTQASTANSGLYVVVPINTISGVNAIVPPVTLSGVVANSGLYVTVPPATISGVVANSGLYTVVPPATLSGLTVSVVSGTVFPASGTGGSTGSGLYVVVPTNTISGVNAIVPPATLSGVVTNSGLYTTVPVSTLSGIVANSGLYATVPPSTLSGITANSGLYTTVPPSTLSGVVANSGLNVVAVTSVNPASISGAYVTVLPANLSGVVANSGLSVNAAVTPSTLSGVYSVAGSVLDKFGYALVNSGLDQIQVETGLNMRQAQSVIAASVAGKLSGAGSNTIRIDGAGVPGTQRILATVTTSGNRLTVSLTPPA